MAPQSNYATAVSRRQTLQSEPIPGREADQVQNDAGGFAYAITAWDRLARFLILGSDSGTYYVGGREMTKQCAAVIDLCIKEDHAKVVDMIEQVSVNGRAPSNDPALFALAVVCSSKIPGVSILGFKILPKVARTGTHLFHFVDYLNGMRGWGRAAKAGVADWYLNQDLNDLAFQVTKYRQRDRWSHRDVLRLSHPKTKDEKLNSLFQWIVKPFSTPIDYSLPLAIHRWKDFQNSTGAHETAELLRRFPRSPREWILTEHLGDPQVWKELMKKMPIGALIRNLPTLTRHDLLTPLSDKLVDVCNRLEDRELILKGRVHPLKTLVALKTYAKGQSLRGSHTWRPLKPIVDALNSAFYHGFGTVEPINKRVYIGIDISGSMGYHDVADVPITPREACAAMSMVFARRAKRHYIRGFGDELIDIPVSPVDSLNTVVNRMIDLRFGWTDCALPMLDAKRQGIPVDAFIVLTDGDTWAGDVHPSQALTDYRNSSGINSKFIVLCTTPSRTSIADPNDPNSLDVAGFDTSVPSVVEEFVRG